MLLRRRYCSVDVVLVQDFEKLMSTSSLPTWKEDDNNTNIADVAASNTSFQLIGIVGRRDRASLLEMWTSVQNDFSGGGLRSAMERKDNIFGDILQVYPCRRSIIIVSHSVQAAGARRFHVKDFVFFSEGARGTVL